MSLVLPVEATEEALGVFAAELAGAVRVLSLEGGGAAAAARFGEEDGAGAGARGVGVVVVRCCHVVVLPAELLVLALTRRPCTCLSALQAR